MRLIEVPRGERLELEHLLLDANGTLTDGGVLIAGVEERLARLADGLELHLVTADTFGLAAALAERLGLALNVVASATDKAAYASRLGAARVVAIGNGRNDEAMLRVARVGIAVIGPEGASVTSLVAADVVCGSITAALDLLADERRLIATLRP
jgi:soluble P-type ATPase